MIEFQEYWTYGRLSAVSINGEKADYAEICEQIYALMMGWA